MIGGISLMTGPIMTSGTPFVGPTITHLHTFVDSTDGKTTAYTFNVNIPATTKGLVMLYGIGPTTAAQTGLTTVTIGGEAMVETTALTPNQSWFPGRPGIGGYTLGSPPTGASVAVSATPEAATEACSILLFGIRGFHASPIGAADHFAESVEGVGIQRSITTTAANSRVLVLGIRRQGELGTMSLTDQTYTYLIGAAPPTAGFVTDPSPTADDHSGKAGFFIAAAAGAHTYGVAWDGTNDGGVAALELKVP